MKKKKKLLFLVNNLSFFISHRLSIAEAAIAKGYDIFIGYGKLGDADLKLLEKKNFKVNYIEMHSSSFNIFKDFKTIFYIWKFFKKVKPDIIHLITIKPYLYGGIVSRLLGVQSLVSAVSGLGTLFINNNLKNRLVRLILYPFYCLAFNHSNQRIIIQNKEDIKELINWGVLLKSKVKLIKGSGVKIDNFKDLDERQGIPVVCFAARLLWNKGVYELVQAARILKARGIKAKFFLAGDLDIGNPSGLNIKDLNELKKEDHIEFIGYQKDIPKLYALSHIICLPSYREGLPKALIEAAAASRAIVTTDVPGCRDSIIPNKTGLLVPIKDPQKLAEALKWLIEHPKERLSMGKAGRKFAEKEFKIEKIVQEHLDIYEELSNKVM